MPETIDWLDYQSTWVQEICPSTDSETIWLEFYSTRVADVCPLTDTETIQLKS